MILFIATLSIAASSAEYYYKAILPDTKIYKESDINSEIIAMIPQNAIVEAISEKFEKDGRVWQEVSYNSIKGFTLFNDLYKSREEESFTIKHGKACSVKMGENIKVYKSNDMNSEIVYVLHDGEKLDIIDNGIDYGVFNLINYKGGRYFVLKANVTTSLSYNQRIALIIGLSSVGAVIIFLVIYFIVKNKKTNKDTQ